MRRDRPMASIVPVSDLGPAALATNNGGQISRPSDSTENTQKNVRPAELTWTEMQSAFMAYLKEKGKGAQEKNFKTAIKFFLRAVEKTEDSPVGEELTEEFEVKLGI